jgi:hypothetical protein
MSRFMDETPDLTPFQWRRKVDALRTAALRSKPNPFDGHNEQADLRAVQYQFRQGSCRRMRCAERPGLVFPSMSAAAAWCGMSRSNFCHRFKNMDGTVSGLHFEYVAHDANRADFEVAPG